MPQGSTVASRAVPLNPDEPWPDDPFAPTWNHNGKPFWGELTYLYYPTSTPEGEDGETVDVSCGNTFSMKVKVEAETEAGGKPNPRKNGPSDRVKNKTKAISC